MGKKKPLRIKTIHCPGYSKPYKHHISGEKGKKIIIKMDSDFQVRTLSRIEGRNVIASREAIIKIKYVEDIIFD